MQPGVQPFETNTPPSLPSSLLHTHTHHTHTYLQFGVSAKTRVKKRLCVCRGLIYLQQQQGREGFLLKID